MPLTDERIDPNPEGFETEPFYNYTDRDFIAEEGAMWNSHPYPVKAGEIKFYPVFLANHLAKHLINREIIRVNEANMMDKKTREEIKVKILISQDEANRLLGMPTSDRIVKSPPMKKKKKEVITEKEAKASVKSKNREIEKIPEIEHTREYKSVDIKPLS